MVLDTLGLASNTTLERQVSYRLNLSLRRALPPRPRTDGSLSTGRIDWTYNDTRTWTLNAAAMGPDPAAQIGQRLVSEEPMTIILNLAM